MQTQDTMRNEMNKYVEAVACLNNHGVDALQHGVDSYSFKLLLEALQISKISFTSQAQQQGGQQDPQPRDAFNEPVSQEPRYRATTSERVQNEGRLLLPHCNITSSHPEQEFTSPPRQHCVISTSILTYNQGIRIDCTALSNTNDVVVQSRVCAATVTFNLALCHHLPGKHGDTVQQYKLLQKAKLLYSKSHALLLDYFQSFRCPLDRNAQRASNELLACAVLNNIAALEYELMNYEKSIAMFNRLVQYVQISSKYDTTTTRTTNERKESFHGTTPNSTPNTHVESFDGTTPNSTPNTHVESFYSTTPSSLPNTHVTTILGVSSQALLQRNRFLLNAMIHQYLSPTAAAA